jgi:hypothetical protein
VSEDRLDALLALDRPVPTAEFDARVRAAIAADEAALDALLAADAPVPSPGFDARVRAALGDGLDGVLAADRPAPSPGFDARVRAGLRAERRGRRGWWIAGALAAAAAVALFFVAPRGEAELDPEADPALLAHLDLLEVYGEVEALDALEDEETFDLVASLDDVNAEGTP